MSSEQERILLVESDPEISDLIAQQALQPLGYRVKVVGSASEAIQQAVLYSPHLVVANLDLPDLSGKDLLVALTSQGLKTPVIMIAEQGREQDVIQAFRLGAADYLTSPVREAELVSVVERSLRQTRARREREQLARQLRQTNQELQRRVRELTTLFAIGKAVTSITDQNTLFDRIAEGAVFITDAQRGWVMVRQDEKGSFFLRAYRNLPKSLAAHLNQPWDDGISSLVAMSGESLAIHGNPLQRFPISRLGQAALVVPVKVQNVTVGLLVVMREAPQPFQKNDQTRLEAVADYASISLANARLFRVLEARAQSLQKAIESSRESEKSKDSLIREISAEVRQPLEVINKELGELGAGRAGKLNRSQQEELDSIRRRVADLENLLDSLTSLGEVSTLDPLVKTDLNPLVREAIRRNQHVAQQTGLALLAELSSDPVYAMADTSKINQVLDGLITNAIKFCPQGGQISIQVRQSREEPPHVMVKDTGPGLSKEDLAHVFDTYPPDKGQDSHYFQGLGLRLAFIRDIIHAHGGKVWAESTPGQGTEFHFTLQPETQS